MYCISFSEPHRWMGYRLVMCIWHVFMCVCVCVCLCVCVCVCGWMVSCSSQTVCAEQLTDAHTPALNRRLHPGPRTFALTHTHTHTHFYVQIHTTHVACLSAVFGSCWVSWVCLRRQRETWYTVFVCVYRIICIDHICHRRLGPKGLRSVDLATVLHWHVWG